MNIRRICLFGGPGIGKSTMAHHVTYELSRRGHRVEFVKEYIKEWVFQGRQPKPWDQIDIFSEQLRQEYLVLTNDDKAIVVTECPILLTCFYSEYYNNCISGSLIDLADKFEQQFPSLNIMLRRDIPFDPSARYHNEIESRKIDGQLKEFLYGVSDLKLELCYRDEVMTVVNQYIRNGL